MRKKLYDLIFGCTFGHDWRYNFPNMSNKAICRRCKQKAEFDIHKLEWNNVKEFKHHDGRTDDELIEKWVKPRWNSWI